MSLFTVNFVNGSRNKTVELKTFQVNLCHKRMNQSFNMCFTAGLRLTITPDLRPQEAGLWEIGVGVSPRQVVPPQETDFVSYGHCHSRCVNLVWRTKQF